MIRKKILFGMALVVILAAFLTCDSASISDEPSGFNPPNPGSVAISSFNYQTVHTQQIKRTGWSGNIEYPVITVISSKSELEVYYYEYKDNFNFNRFAGSYSSIGFTDAVEKYSEDFFVDNFLVIVLLSETSGSNRHRVRMYDNGDIEVTRLIPEVGTTDMAQWTVIIELNNPYKQDQFSVVFVEERM